MQVKREGRLTDGRVGTGDILSLEINMMDARALLDPGAGPVMNRFQGFRQLVAGWAPEDKAWVNLNPSPRSQQAIASLALDAGGDLYFTLWDNEALRQADMCEVFDDLDSFVTSDPSNKLGQLGINTVRIYYLPAIENARDELEFTARYVRPAV